MGVPLKQGNLGTRARRAYNLTPQMSGLWASISTWIYNYHDCSPCISYGSSSYIVTRN